jgi:alkylation response protein AidB-like acyl-CoA dehydrogenase
VADGVGAAARALERAVEYAKQREQFGRPIGSFQAVQHLLVDMLQDVELARAASVHALWAQDAAPAAERARASALAKAFASEALPRVGASAIQVFGGIGFTFELDLHRYYRRLLSLSLLHGDAAHHLERIAEAAFARDERP